MSSSRLISIFSISNIHRWSSGYRRGLLFQRSRVRVCYTSLHFFLLIFIFPHVTLGFVEGKSCSLGRKQYEDQWRHTAAGRSNLAYRQIGSDLLKGAFQRILAKDLNPMDNGILSFFLDSLKTPFTNPGTK